MAAVNTVAQLLILTLLPSTDKSKKQGSVHQIFRQARWETKAGHHLCPQDIKAAHRKGQKALSKVGHQHQASSVCQHPKTPEPWLFALGEESDISSISRWELNTKVLL